MKVYFISGLGADNRVFKNILLPEGHDTLYLDWITPLPHEPLADYALRLAQKIDIRESYALVGLSMGGMMVSEICKFYSPAIAIIISSVPVSYQIPYYLRMAGQLGLHKLIPVRILKSASFVKSAFRSEATEDRIILQRMVREIDTEFINWAISAIVKWRNEEFPSSYIHIHGTMDRLLPVRLTRPTHLIENAGHALILNRAKEINSILKRVFASGS